VGSVRVITWLRDDGWTRLIRVAAPLGAFVLEGWPALVGALVVQEGGLWVAGRLSGDCQRSFARRLFVAAYGLRVAIALPTHYVAKLGDGNGALFRDDYTNDLVGEWLVRIARGDGGVAIFAGHQYLLDSVYTYLLMGIYTVFGYTPLLPKLLNVSLAALSAVLIFDIAQKIFSRRAAMLAATGAVVLPSLVVWSVATLKETPVLITSLLALWVVQFLTTADRRERRIADQLVLLLAVVLLLLDLRSATAVIIVGLTATVFIARSPLSQRSWHTALAALVVVAIITSGVIILRGRSSDRPLAGVFEDAVLQIRHRRAQEAASARSQLRPEIDVISPRGSELPAAEAASDAAPFTLLTDVIDPLGYALLAPTPWQAQSPTELAASAEMPVWYVLLVASFFARGVAPGQRLFVGCLVVYAIANWFILAAVEGNIGNLLRHRLMLDPILLILGAAGLESLWARFASLQFLPSAGQPILSHEDVTKLR
jgi:hypothetical protein